MAIPPDENAAAPLSMSSSSLTFALQALLHRHESYMAEAEDDRKRLLANIENLEREKRQVQAENARIIEENRGLLEQLDGLNKAVAASDAHANSLAATLENTEAELRQVTASAARAADLEAQLAQIEAEQSRLQDSLQIAQEDEKSAVQRWKKAECTLRDLHDQVDRIEKEAREERQRHAELVQRMERRRAVERELDGAAGRLKGAAAAQELDRNRGNPNVVSRFVRDILQDNAHLQMGIIELREMLESSNQEVQNLRDQVLSHRPLTANNEDDEGQPRPQPTTLSQELEPKESRRVSSEFHIHHHYHSPSIPASSKKDKGTIFRRSKKRRSLGTATVMHSASSSQISRRSAHQPQSSISSTSTILSQTSVSIPPPAASRRWSLRSPAAESIASSPQSGYRTSSIFDRVERGSESSQPSSPESTALSSPIMKSRHKHIPFDVPFRPLDGMDEPERVGTEESMQFAYDYFGQRTHGELSDRMPLHSIIPEEMEDALSAQFGESIPNNQPSADPDDVFSPSRSPLRSRQSHESLFSIAGMDIHTPSRRPSRMSDLHSSLPIRAPRRIISPSAELFSPSPVISTSTVTAGREPPKVSEHSPRRLLATVVASRARAGDDAPFAESAEIGSDSTVTPSRKASLSRRVGGWVRGRWGIAPTSSNGDTEPRAESDMATAQTPESPASSRPSSAGKQKSTSSFDAMPKLRYRFPGVNQSGPIMGFRPPPQAPVSLHPEQLDENLLRESLAE
ncbi:uncharacterized protein ACLA_065400 [Aspergillus clavatus NRRL 1]|uniref:Uncharacterized protein n=1 Tax=Aspergillus clavatus (strain ATCC 1007 / CBS 513.65 / DSM 816 / NCTC 3887 / NRRL 1 / QM 1276 / 107) TaxID=344612 RepID=A1CG26_ASPCL|nr:uncharacterized protein ACLA_065400 [Aspergillus clavatus NRRL 1]EAW10906.1 conserved hypothetical protein [Aspergillus clavatus NRRL 1]